MYSRSFLTVGVLILLLNSGLSGSPKLDDAKDIQGTWTIVSAEGADKIPAEALKKVRMRITADQLIVQLEGKDLNTSKYKLDSTKKTKEIDLVVKVLIDEKVRVVISFEPRMGIYELMGDDLKICVAMATSKKVPDPPSRPKEFKTGGDLTVLILRRDK